MSKFCTNCGTQLEDNVNFCPNCGTKASANASEQPNPAQYTQQGQPNPVQYTQQGQPNTAQYTQQGQPNPAQYTQQGQPNPAGAYAGNGMVRQGIPAPGFSNRVNHPEILAAVKKKRKAAGVFALFLVPLPFIGFIIYSIVSDKMETADAAKYGAIVSAIFLVFAIYSLIKERPKNTYEAIVVDKKTRRTNDKSDNDNYYTEYITVVKTTEGKKKKIVEREGSQIWAWNYLEMGDRFKYHPQFNFPYELYDKSKAPYIVCISCGTKNPVEDDRCKKCGLPLIK
ncbi:MAG: zinc-ribbon domain-containing protein [Lachnospiraceae bacterium]|nr:zinc-ribbon domain-containing protein [Lachnospiraceae bacterium]